MLWAVSTLQHKYHDHGYDGHDLEDNECSIKIPHSAYDDNEDAKVMIKCVVVGSQLHPCLAKDILLEKVFGGFNNDDDAQCIMQCHLAKEILPLQCV